MELRVAQDYVNYDLLEKEGYLLTTEVNVVHYGFIEHFIEYFGIKYNILEIAIDGWRAILV